MRLLMRRGSQRAPAEGVTVVAASPDTPQRERWQWQASVVEGGQEESGVPDVPVYAHVVTLPLGRSVYGTDPAVLHVAADPDHAIADVGRIDLDEPATLTKRIDEVAVLLVDRGSVVVEGRHLLGVGDVLVLEGDDPVEISVAERQGPAGVTVARLTPAAGRTLGWVP